MFAGPLFAAAAAVAFGVQYVPVKSHPTYEGATFQFFMANGILIVGVVVSLLVHDFGKPFSSLIVLGGILWSISNYLVVLLVKVLGLGRGFSLYHFVNLVVGYLVGRLGLFGVKHLQGNLQMCDLGCFFVLVSFSVMCLVEQDEESDPVAAPQGPAVIVPNLTNLEEGAVAAADVQCYREAGSHKGKDGTAYSEASTDDAALDAETGSQSTVGISTSGGISNGISGLDSAIGGRTDGLNVGLSSPLLEGTSRCSQSSASSTRLLRGILLALLAGGFCGVQSVPATLHNAAHPNEPAMAAVFPQTLGIWIASSVIYLCYATAAYASDQSVPHPGIRPAYLSGVIWATGFTFMILAIKSLGYSVAYTLDAVGPIVVASLLSIIFFKEIQGRRQISLYMLAFFCQLIGVGLICAFGKEE